MHKKAFNVFVSILGFRVHTKAARGGNARVIATVQISAVFVKTVVMSWGDDSPLPRCVRGISF